MFFSFPYLDSGQVDSEITNMGYFHMFPKKVINHPILLEKVGVAKYLKISIRLLYPTMKP